MRYLVSPKRKETKKAKFQLIHLRHKNLFPSWSGSLNLQCSVKFVLKILLILSERIPCVCDAAVSALVLINYPGSCFPA